MIAISGAIGTGLFLGSGGSIAKTGPGLIFTYALTGVFIFFIMRALGELLLYRPVSGSIGAYAAEFLGRAAGFCTGWGYWVTWSVIGMAEITAAGIYVRYWFPAVPQWLTALVVLVGLLVANLISVRAFGEFEFWFSVIKVSTILVVVVGGTLAVVTGFAGHQAGFSNLWDEGGFAPHGWLPVLVAVQLAVFSFQGVELVGMTAGEAKDPHTVLPKAINSIVLRIAVFYVAAVTVLVSVLPWTSFHSGESPFVQVFGHLGIPGGAGIMNFVVITACLSACNSGLYSNSRLLRNLAHNGQAPRLFRELNGRRVPAKAIVASAAMMAIGVPINALSPDKAFVYISSIATLGAIGAWAVIVVCQMRYRRQVDAGRLPGHGFRMPWARVTAWLVLAFLGAVTVLLGFDADNRIALYALPVWAAAFAVAYLLHRRRGARPAVRGAEPSTAEPSTAEPSSAEPSTAGLPD
jgi:L-asparagine transporter-like permease